MPTLERYQGVYFRVLKKYVRENRLKDTDIIVISERFGVLKPTQKVPYYPPFEGVLPQKEVERNRETNLNKLRKLLSNDKYSEIFVVCGRNFYSLIQGFEKFTNAKVIYAQGRGLGPKAQHLRNWILRMS